MTSRLANLRSQLAGLRRARAAVRLVAAWSAVAISLLAALAAFFAIDLVFELAVPQRIVVLLLAGVGIGWAFWRFTRPLLGLREGELDVALVVEREQNIDSDLVAALQFEQPQAISWGSPQLATAVIEYVAAAGRGIDFFEGFSRTQMTRRLGVLGLGLVALLLAIFGWPEHMAALASRLLLSSQHYPTQTRIEQVLVNSSSVLLRGVHGNRPDASKCAQGQPLTFLVQCSGRLPPAGAVHLTAADGGGSRTRLTLRPLTSDERLTRLQEALARLHEGAAHEWQALLPPWRDAVHALVRFDAPAAVAPLAAATSHADLAPVVAAVSEAIGHWPGNSGRSVILYGSLGRLNESLTYKLTAGDAWTDSADIEMIPLPIVELRLTPVPPAYAQGAIDKPDPSGRQLAVLEGSSVELTVESVNRKRLESVWLAVQSKDGMRQISLTPRDATGLVWSLPSGAAALTNIRQELRYEIQVLDADGLSLETPIRGTIRLRLDHPPSGLAEVIHKVVLPTAEPVVAYRASDDFGISRLRLQVEVERSAGRSAVTLVVGPPAADGSETSLTPAAIVPTETHHFEIDSGPEPASGPRLPLAGQFALPLAPLGLAKGDRIKLTLEVTDYRGENEPGGAAGVTQQAEPLVLEISDEAGVLAAVSQADPRSEERLNEIIQRQLGIGETP